MLVAVHIEQRGDHRCRADAEARRGGGFPAALALGRVLIGRLGGVGRFLLLPLLARGAQHFIFFLRVVVVVRRGRRRLVGHRLSISFTGPVRRSEEHTSELQSLMRISYAVFCLKKKNNLIITYLSSIHTCTAINSY